MYLPEEYVERSGRAYPWERLYRQFVGRLTIDDAGFSWEQRRPEVVPPISVPTDNVAEVRIARLGLQTRLYFHTTSGDTHVFTTFRGGKVRAALSALGLRTKEAA